jgi:hypothetical protein
MLDLMERHRAPCLSPDLNPLAAALALLGLVACHPPAPRESRAAAPDAGFDPGVAVQGARTPACDDLRRRLAEVQIRHAGAPARCAVDADCTCYGGPLCPNALVRTCPAPIAASAYRDLAPLDEAWRRHGCGGYAWSPYGCHARCGDGHCASDP